MGLIINIIFLIISISLKYLKILCLVINSPKAFGEFQTLLSPPPSPSPSPLKFLFSFLILSAFFPNFLICCLLHTCPNLPKLAQTCPNLPKLAQTYPNLPIIAQISLFSHCLIKRTLLGFGDFPRPMHWSLLRICPLNFLLF